jgi:hypothetical protein
MSDKKEEFKNYFLTVEKIINNDELTNQEKYLEITGNSVSKTSARKRIYGIRDFINSIKRNDPIDIEMEPTDIESETNIEIKGRDKQVSSRIIPVPVDNNDNDAAEKMKDPQFLLEKHGYDPYYWQVDYSKSSIYNTQQKGGRIVTLFSSKIKVSRIEDDISYKELADFLEEEINAEPKEVPYKHKGIQGDLLSEISTVDLHIGKLGWEPECDENYDIHIAEDRFRKIINDHVYRLKGYPISKFLYVLGNDLFHYDNNKQTTNLGTFQHSDVRWAKMFKYGVRLSKWAIEKLSDIAPVKVLMVPGNHDLKTSYYAGYALNEYFRNNENVEIDTRPRRRKYYQFGENLIGFAHGKDLTKKNRLTIMQTEAPEKWGNTKFREFHCGHLHSESSFEHGSIIFRNLSSVTGSDEWHYKKGYVGAVKKSQNFIYHKDKGLYEIKHSIIDY